MQAVPLFTSTTYEKLVISPAKTILSSIGQESDLAGTNEEEDMSVLIIGAGPAGLLIAQGLRAANISYAIYEASTDFTYAKRPRDWSMGGRAVLESLLLAALLDRLPEASTAPVDAPLTDHQRTNLPLLNGATGEVLAHINMATTNCVSRTRLRDLFATDIDVRWGKRLARIDPGSPDGGVKAYFEDGTIAHGTALIGCDGAKSAVRAWLLGLEHNVLEIMPLMPYNVQARYTREQALFIASNGKGHPLMKYAVHPDRHWVFILAPLDIHASDPVDWIFQLWFDMWLENGEGKGELPTTSAERLAHFKACAEHYEEPFRSAVRWLPDDTVIPEDHYTHMPGLMRWDNHGGRVTLAGDSAHPMSPFRGQGLNNALEDAAKYVDVVKKVATGKTRLEEAVEAFDEEVHVRGKGEIAVSAKQAFATHHFDVLMESPIIKAGLHKVAVAD